MRGYTDRSFNQNYGLRYIGSMVSDIHIIILQGGFFLYASTRKYTGSKLRLLYECAPIAIILEQAGESAIDGNLQRILEVNQKLYRKDVRLYW